MMTATMPDSRSDADSQDGRAPRPTALRATLAVVGAVLLSGGWLLPLWRARLHAPQYPGGLLMRVYGHQATGDVNEINALNHYVGLGVFDPADVPEMALWPFALGAALVAVLIAALWRRGWVRGLALAYLWALPVGVLGMIQFRLHQFGHAIEPGAAFRLDPFTPWVAGRTTIWNFETWAWPGPGLVAIVLAAAVLTFGPRLLSRGRRRSGRSGEVAAALAAGLLLAAMLPGGSPAIAADGHEQGGHERHDDGGHDHGGHVEAPPTRVGPATPHNMPHTHDHDSGPMIDLAGLLAETPPGGVLRLPGGTYQGPVVIDRPVTIEGAGLPAIVGDGTGDVVTIQAGGTTLRNLVVRGSGPGPTGNPAGIRIEADDVTVEGVVIQDSYAGIAVDSAADVKLVGNHIHGRATGRIADEAHATEHDGERQGGDSHDDHRGHTFSGATPGRGDGIWLHDGDHVLVRGNHIQDVRDGLYLSFGSGTLVDGNHVHRSRYAVHSMFARDLALVENHFRDNLSGIVLMYGGEGLLLRNHIERSTSAATGFAVILKDVVDIEAVENLLVGNRVGIHLDGPTETTSSTVFKANTVGRNAVGVQAKSSARATFTANSFAGNQVQVLSLGGDIANVTWAEGPWGNYWSTYRGYDAHGEGRGAVAHTEGGSMNRLLLRSPELVAIADRPAMRLLRSVEERWGQRRPVMTDELPLTRPLSPGLPVPPADPLAQGLAMLGGLVLLAPTMLLARRRHRIRTAARRTARVVTT